MNLDELFGLLGAAYALCGHREYVVVGSLSVLAMAEVTAIPADMTMSIDADCYTRSDPGRVFDLQAALGEGSPYHRTAASISIRCPLGCRHCPMAGNAG